MHISTHGGTRKGAGSQPRMIALGVVLEFVAEDGMPPIVMTVIEKTRDHAVLQDNLGTVYRVRIVGHKRLRRGPTQKQEA